MSSKIIRAEETNSKNIMPLSMEELISGVDDDMTPADENTLPSPSTDIDSEDGSGGEDKVEIMKREAFEEGFLKGKEEGFMQSMEKVQPLLDRFVESLNEVDGLRERLFSECERNIVDLIVASAEKVIQKELSLDADIAAGVIKKALKSLTDRKEILIRVNPEDYRLIQESRKRLFGDVGDLKQMTFAEDDVVGRGGCLIESRFGEIDARIEKQLELLKEGMKGALNG